MTNRRSLSEGFTPVDPAAEHAFVYQPKQPTEKPKANSNAPVAVRTQLSSRIRSDLFEALKQASLKRQLAGTKPNSITEILEEAIEPWLKSNGYLN
jgi:hypothetical protein